MVLVLINFFFFFQDAFPLVLTGYTDDTKAIMIFAPDNRSSLYSQSITMLTHDPLGLDNRNIIIFEVFSEGGIGPDGESYTSVEVASIRRHFNIMPAEFNILLSHKNFQEIFRSDKPLTVHEIFLKFDEAD